MKKQEIMDRLIVKPKKMVVGEGVCSLNGKATVYTNAVDTDLSYLLSLAGYEGNVREVSYEHAYVLLIGTNECPEVTYVWSNDEEYILDVNKDSIVIAGKTIEGMILGLKSLIRMVTTFEELPCVHVEDYPDIPFRSVHLCVFRPDDGSEKEESHPVYLKKMMKTAAILGYNYVIVEFWGMFPYSMDYAHWPNAYSKEEIKDLVSFAMDKLHIRPLPAQNFTSHAGWSRIITRQHTVLDQRPDLADMYIPGGWCFATENPKTKEFIKTLINELVEMFRNPPYLHACCDKAFGFGSTEEDRTMSADILFAKHISFLNSYLREKDVRMVMWSDMLYSSMDALYWKCDEKIADYLPKNILVNIWTHNDPGKKWRDAAFFEDKGFETVYSPFMQEKSIESMIELCRERGSHGMVQTTWHKPQSALPYVILSGALQWCGKKPTKEQINSFSTQWYV